MPQPLLMPPWVQGTLLMEHYRPRAFFASKYDSPISIIGASQTSEGRRQIRLTAQLSPFRAEKIREREFHEKVAERDRGRKRRTVR